MVVTEKVVKKKLTVNFPSKNTQADSERTLCEIGHAKFPVSSGSNKHKPDLVLEGQKEKRRKMDQSVKLPCTDLLNALISHPNGWVFKSPVDPVAFNIPDYFSIISHPMDLGTIKSKLAGDKYFTAEDFASDVKLTFSNAMLYNPPDNYVHHMAKHLECMFIRRWKLLEAKWKHRATGAQHGMISPESEKNAQDMRNSFYKKSERIISSGSNKNAQSMSKACYEKPQWMISSGSEKNAQDTKKACYKKSFLDSSSAAKRSMSIEGKQKLRKDLMEMLEGQKNEKLRTVLKKLGLNDFKRGKIDLDIDALDDDILWELKRVLKDSLDANSPKDFGGKISSAHANILDLDSDGSGSGLDEENTCPNPSFITPVTTAISGRIPLLDDECSLKKALRAAMLKCRFAATISKANGNTANPRKVQQERHRLERLQCEEAAKIKARIREERLKKEGELKMQREKQREAARIALQMMERTAYLDDNLMILKELETLSQCSAFDNHRGCLERLGLYIKKEFLMDDDEDDEALMSWEGEEGEIFQ